MIRLKKYLFPIHILFCLATGFLAFFNPGSALPLRTAGWWGLFFFSLWYLFNQKKPYKAADGVTGLRLITGLTYSFFVWPPPAAVLIILFAEILDGVDGKLARRQGPTAFGAVWDSETDAYFILILSLYAFRHISPSAWFLLPGLMRYLFYFPFVYLKPEGFKFPGALSLFSKTVCVITVLAYAQVNLTENRYGEPVMILISLALTVSFLWEMVVYLRLKTRNRY